MKEQKIELPSTNAVWAAIQHWHTGGGRERVDAALKAHVRVAIEADRQRRGESMKVPSVDDVVQLCESLGWQDVDHDDVHELVVAALHRFTQPAQPTASAEPVYQFRKKHCADWYDGHPDHSDGGGPYEVRTLYAAPVAAQPSVPDDAEHMAYVASLPEVRCSKCDQLVLSSCDWQGKFSGCPVPDAYAHRRTAAPTPPAAEQAQQDAALPVTPQEEEAWNEMEKRQ